ncbi:MAG: hypothetical protein Q9203_002377 [Teloschistes exilis]
MSNTNDIATLQEFPFDQHDRMIIIAFTYARDHEKKPEEIAKALETTHQIGSVKKYCIEFNKKPIRKVTAADVLQFIDDLETNVVNTESNGYWQFHHHWKGVVLYDLLQPKDEQLGSQAIEEFEPCKYWFKLALEHALSPSDEYCPPPQPFPENVLTNDS